MFLFAFFAFGLVFNLSLLFWLVAWPEHKWREDNLRERWREAERWRTINPTIREWLNDVTYDRSERLAEIEEHWRLHHMEFPYHTNILPPMRRKKVNWQREGF